MPEGYPGHSDVLIQSKCGNQSYIRQAGPKNGQNKILTAIIEVTVLFGVKYLGPEIIFSWSPMPAGSKWPNQIFFLSNF